MSIIHSSQLTDFLACCSRRSDSSLSFSKFWSAILRECDSVCGAKRAVSASQLPGLAASSKREKVQLQAGAAPSLPTLIPPGIEYRISHISP